MLTNDKISPKGQVDIEIWNSGGMLVEEISIPNLVVTTGRDYIASRFDDTAQDTAMSNMAVGTGTTAAAIADTALETELSRVALDSTGIVANVITYTATFGTGVGTGALTEAGIFNAGTGGTMLCRTVFDVVNKAPDDTMVITWTITVS